MELKQRLIELVEELVAICECSFGEETPTFEQAAKFLIANGVTIRERGEWILEHETYGKMICSACKKECPIERKPDPYAEFQMTDFYIESDFCPNCGADMRGAKDE